MKNQKTKIICSLSIILLLLFSVVTLIAPLSNAHTPPWTIPTYAYVAISPDPAGVGQTVFLTMWVSPNPPTAIGVGGDRWRDFTITVTKPDGTTEKLGPFTSDATGSTYTLYTPTQLGNYNFVFDYPGQILSQYGPTGIPAPMADLASRGLDQYIGDTYLASTAQVTLTVQQSAAQKLPDHPLPTSFWTRPIEGQNTEWVSVSSNFLAGAQIYGRWQKDGTAPNTAHIMWNKQVEFGGVVGGTTSIPGVAFYGGQSYEGRFTNPIITQGRLYFPMPLGHSGGDPNRLVGGGGYVCLNLYTGEEEWYTNDIGYGGVPAPIKAQLFDYESMNQHGTVGGILWQVIGTTWVAYDAYLGSWMYNLTKVPNGFEVYTTKGEILRYVLNYNDISNSGWLALWNNTQDNVGLAGAIGISSNAYQWRPIGKSVDMSTAYSWNVTVPSLKGSAPPAILAVIPGDIIIGRSVAFSARFGTPDPYTMWAISDKPESRGQLLWLKNYPAPSGNVSRLTLGGTFVDPVNRVFIMNDLETMQLYGYSIDNGEELWGPAGADLKAFQYYGTVGTSGQNGYVAYGNVYTQGYGGEIHCYSTKDGQLLWKYSNTNSGLETPWGNYPTFIGAIADGKVYAFNSEHSPNTPLYKGSKVRCINAYTGEELWTLLSWGSVGGFDSGAWPVADGFLVYRNAYDNQIYCIGKGPSKTAVSANPGVISQGGSVEIVGTVTDISAGAKSKVESGEFNVIAAVSDNSQAGYMEYIYMQKPMPTTVNGVPVTLFATDESGITQQIAQVTSDSGGMFHYKWLPAKSGEYVINAVFEGSGSYWSSSATTAIGVDVASGVIVSPSPTPTVAPTPGTGISTETLLIAGAAVVIIIAVIAAALVLRKRK